MNEIETIRKLRALQNSPFPKEAEAAKKADMLIEKYGYSSADIPAFSKE